MRVTRSAKAGQELPVDTLSKFLAPGILLILTLVFGVWLSLSGKPYNGVLFNIHKLIALAAVVLFAVVLIQLLKGIQLPVARLIFIILAGLCVLALFFTGAMLSAGKLDYQVMLTIHRIAIILMVIAMAVTIYLFTGRKI